MEEDKQYRLFRGDRIQDKTKLRFFESTLASIADNDGEIDQCLKSLDDIGINVYSHKNQNKYKEYPIYLTENEYERFEVCISIIKDHYVFALENLKQFEEMGIKMDLFERHRKNSWSAQNDSGESDPGKDQGVLF